MFHPFWPTSGNICFYIHFSFSLSPCIGQSLHLGVIIWCYVPMSHYTVIVKILKCEMLKCYIIIRVYLVYFIEVLRIMPFFLFVWSLQTSAYIWEHSYGVMCQLHQNFKCYNSCSSIKS
jgi:hypothetical protein